MLALKKKKYKAKGAYTLVHTSLKNAENPLISKGVVLKWDFETMRKNKSLQPNVEDIFGVMKNRIS